MVLIYLFEDQKRYAPVCERLLAEVGRGAFEAVVTPITMAELIVKPLKEGRPDLANAYRAVLTGHPNLSLSAIDSDIGWMAGALRAKYGLALPDMLQAAAAMRAQRPVLISNDRVLRKVEEVEVLLLDDLVG